MANSFINWDAINSASSTPSYENISKLLTANQGSYVDTAGAAITPYLQTGTDPYLQQAIQEIVRQGKESKARSISDVGTTAQSRGLTGSSIESGDIAQTSANMENTQQGQIANLLADDAKTKNTQMINFLTQAYGLDYQQANSMADNLAQLMGQELGRQNDLAIADKTAKAYKDSQSGWLSNIAPSLITGAATVLSKSDRRAKKDILKIGEVSGVNLYTFKYIGKDDTCFGVMADEVKHIPGAVISKEGEYDMVDYSKVVDYMKEHK